MRRPFVVLGSLVAVPIFLNELFIGIPTPWWGFALVMLLFAAGLFQPRPIRQQRRPLACFAAIGLTLIVLHVVPWPTRSPFLRLLADLYAIRRGMTPAEVRNHMARHKEGSGWPANPFDPTQRGGEFTVTGALIFRPASAGPGDSDWGIVHFEQGRVTRVEFSPD